MSDTPPSQPVRYQVSDSKPASAGHYDGVLRSRHVTSLSEEERSPADTRSTPSAAASWRRMVLLIVAITVHNIPG